MTKYHLLLFLVVMRTASKGTETSFSPAPRKPPTPTMNEVTLPDLSTRTSMISPILASFGSYTLCLYQSVTVKELAGMVCCVPPSAKAAVLMTAIKAVVQASLNMNVLPLKVCFCLAGFKPRRASTSTSAARNDLFRIDARCRRYSFISATSRNLSVGRHLVCRNRYAPAQSEQGLHVRPQGLNPPCTAPTTGGHHGETTEETGRAFSRYVKRHIFCREEDPCDTAEDGESRAIARSEKGLRKAPRRDGRPCRASGKGFRRDRQKAAGQDLRRHCRHHR